jgi:hypothetical protein
LVNGGVRVGVEREHLENGRGGRGVSILAESNRRFSCVDGLARPRAVCIKASFKAFSFKEGSLTKQQQIISKQEMVYSCGISSYLHPLDLSKSFLFEQQSGEQFRTQNEEERREGSPCLKPLEGEKRPKGLPFKRMEKEGEEMQAWIHCS